jgi:hypothetical protein
MAPEDNPVDDEPMDRQDYAFYLMLYACQVALKFIEKDVVDDATPRHVILDGSLDATIHLTSAIQEAEGFLRSIGAIPEQGDSHGQLHG